MRTLVRGGWVVGSQGPSHALLPDGVVVYEAGRIVRVGLRFEGTIDREIDARGKLVVPGFIDTHVHSGHRASHRLITDVGRPDFFGQPFLEISVPREVSGCLVIVPGKGFDRHMSLSWLRLNGLAA